MGPDRNRELFEITTANRLGGMSQEFQRREALGVTLERLSTFFEKVGTTHNLTESTISTRLWALSLVQSSDMGISGFEPLLAINRDEPNGSVEAKKTPAHDVFIDNDSTEYKTRVVNLVMPRYNADENIELYGLNVYVPTAREQSEELSIVGSIGKKRLIILNQSGEIVNETEPITGDTIVFAVRNKKTGDAKAYSVEIEEEDETNLTSSGMSSRVRYLGEGGAIVPLYDGRQVRIRELKEELLLQVIDELRDGSSKLAEIVGQMEGLSSDEQRAVHASISGYHSPED